MLNRYFVAVIALAATATLVQGCEEQSGPSSYRPYSPPAQSPYQENGPINLNAGQGAIVRDRQAQVFPLPAPPAPNASDNEMIDYFRSVDRQVRPEAYQQGSEQPITREQVDETIRGLAEQSGSRVVEYQPR